MGKDVIVACDFASKEQVFEFLDKFTGRKPFLCRGPRNCARNQKTRT